MLTYVYFISLSLSFPLLFLLLEPMAVTSSRWLLWSLLPQKGQGVRGEVGEDQAPDYGAGAK